jgi:cytochrome c553
MPASQKFRRFQVCAKDGRKRWCYLCPADRPELAEMVDSRMPNQRASLWSCRMSCSMWSGRTAMRCPSLAPFFILVLAIVAWTGLAARADDLPPIWAYPVNPPDFKPPAGEGRMHHVPGSDVTYSVSQTRNPFFAPDWHPEAHLPMPSIVASGRKPAVFACAFCHRANGSGGPESASLAGLPRDYMRRALRPN